jgi:Lysozyme inhibitor LprI
MSAPRPSALVFLLLLGSGTAALAQLVLPGARLEEEPGSPAPSAAPGVPRGTQTAPGTPAPARPVVPKAPTEKTVLNRELKLNGSAGALQIGRVGRAELGVRLTLNGTRLSRPEEDCTVRLEDAVALTARGQVDGLMRYEVGAPACPIVADLVDGALWVRGPAEACVIEAADCRVDPRGLWGPDPAALAPLARAIEQDRAQADRAVRENYKALAERARPHDVRALVSEQAAFSAEREMLCRSYAREASHGFCNARFTQARAAQLAARLGAAPVRAAPSRQRP